MFLELSGGTGRIARLLILDFSRRPNHIGHMADNADKLKCATDEQSQNHDLSPEGNLIKTEHGGLTMRSHCDKAISNQITKNKICAESRDIFR
jgi:hypothetical protein